LADVGGPHLAQLPIGKDGDPQPRH
jgi:hypothetical protein